MRYLPAVLLFVGLIAIGGVVYSLLPSSVLSHKQCAGRLDVKIGMTREALLDICGKPEEINTDVNRYAKREQFVYATWRDYVYVEDGVITGIQYK